MSDNKTFRGDKGGTFRQVGGMIISSGRRYIFAHMPKTGGTSLSMALEDRAMKDDILIGDTPKAKKRQARLSKLSAAGRLWKHSTLADIEGVVTRDQMQDWFVLSIVRNPWDRMVSYYHWLQDQNFDHPAVILAQACEFNEFVCNPATVSALKGNPVARYTMDGAGVDHANLVARLEHLTEDLAPFWNHVGFELQIPKINKSKRAGDYRPYFTEQSAAVVAEACAQDIAQYGYVFDAGG